MNLNEHCEKLIKDCKLEFYREEIESFAREIRNEALEEAATEANGRCGMHVDFWNSQKQIAANVIAKAILALKTDALAAKESSDG